MKNYHTHTSRCGHADGTDREYVEAALRRGFSTLGFSDHVPWPYKSGFRHDKVRMGVERLPEYVQSISSLKEEYRDRIEVLLGFEAEYFPEYISWLSETAERCRPDYMILGHHYDVSDETGMYFGNVRYASEIGRYVEQVIAGLRTGLFACLAHPDLFMRAGFPYNEDARSACRDLCDCCLELNIPMEYNLHERYRFPQTHRLSYPNADFFEDVRARGVRVILGVDAHSPEEIENPVQWDLAMQEIGAYAGFEDGLTGKR